MKGPLESARILVADDDGPLGRLFRAVLTGEGHQVEIVTDAETARRRITEGRFDLILLDLTLGPLGGMALLEQARAISPGTTVVIVTGNATVESAVEALKKGAHDYLVKPVRNEQLVVMVRRAMELKRLDQESRQAREALQVEKRRSETLLQEARERSSLSLLSGAGERMDEVRSLVSEVIRTDSTVLLLGESGTGKSLLARVIHRNSRRADKPFVETNCAVYSEGVLLSELFGHESGAFTGAMRQKKGRFELAEGGTVFLDEIGDIPEGAQIALLRFLQERRFERVGGERTLKADVRVVAATHRDLRRAMQEGSFRQDLFYRLHVIPITLPPLRERLEDIPALATRLLGDCAQRLGYTNARFTPQGLAGLTAYPWPGNIRELENAIERAVIVTHGGDVDARHLPGASADPPPPGSSPEAPAPTLEGLEKEHIMRVLQQCRWNKKKAAAALGLHRSSLYSKLHRFGLLEEQCALGAAAGVQNQDTR